MANDRYAACQLLCAMIAAVVAFVAACDDAPPGNGATTKPQRRLADKPSQPDADAPLVESFKARRAAFDELKSMILADPGISEVSLAGASDGQAVGLSAARFDEYKAKLNAAGATAVVSQGGQLAPGEILFDMPTPPGWPAGSRAGILFAEATGLQRVDVVAERLAAAKGIRIARELDLKWYLVGQN